MLCGRRSQAQASPGRRPVQPFEYRFCFACFTPFVRTSLRSPLKCFGIHLASLPTMASNQDRLAFAFDEPRILVIMAKPASSTDRRPTQACTWRDGFASIASASDAAKQILVPVHRPQ
jgi:hypothetical protein